MGILDKLFGKKSSLPPINLGVIKADMHSHLIPGIDDGAATVDDAVELIEELHDMGYSKLITTPHIMSDYYKNTPEIINGGLEKMRNVLKEREIPVQLEAAAEYYMDYEFESKIDNKD
ncbi:MAG: capsular biosynthesis protein, partial [Flavobacteriales bacterium]